MLDLDEIDLLTAWERGRVHGANVRGAMALLAAAYPEQSPASLGQLTIGQRDSLLLALREQLFGVRMHGLSNCTECNETLSVDLDVRDFRLPAGGNSVDPVALEEDDYAVSFRLPNSTDLLAIADARSVFEGRLLLLERLLITATHNGNAMRPDEIPESLLSRVEARMAQIEPQAYVLLNFDCDACHRRTVTLFDIASFLWTEVEVWAIRTLREIHELARAYGWGEAEILRMSPWRRRCYMELLGV